MGQHAPALFSKYMGGYSRGQIIEALDKLPPEEIAAVGQNAPALFSDDTGSGARSTIFKCLARLPLENISTIAKYTQELLPDGVDEEGNIMIIARLAEIPMENIDEVVSSALCKTHDITNATEIADNLKRMFQANEVLKRISYALRATGPGPAVDDGSN